MWRRVGTTSRNPEGPRLVFVVVVAMDWYHAWLPACWHLAADGIAVVVLSLVSTQAILASSGLAAFRTRTGHLVKLLY